MTKGMLWFDEKNKPLSEKICEAVRYYARKYRQTPNFCLVPLTVDLSACQVTGIVIRQDRQIARNHLVVGFEVSNGE